MPKCGSRAAVMNCTALHPTNWIRIREVFTKAQEEPRPKNMNKEYYVCGPEVTCAAHPYLGVYFSVLGVS